MNHGSLFTGIGGFDLAAQWAGWDNVFHCEKEPFCQKILRKRFPQTILYGNIIGTDFTYYRNIINVLSLGFPCKQTSVAAAIHGKRNGLEGEDSGLWYEGLRVIGEILPDWAVVENPSGVKKWEKIITEGLENAHPGYVVSRVETTACSFGFPHQRRRVLYVANRHGKRLEIARPGGSPTAEWVERLTTYGGSWLSATPGTIGGFNGLPNRVDRVRALGNALMPQQAFHVFNAINNSV
jgi:DNA (cytosine-5)-methyltransferase 1